MKDMAIFDELRHLTQYIYEAHHSKKQHLSDLYELVQYAGNIVPRLYMMILVGAVFMRVAKETLPFEMEKTVEIVNTQLPNGASEHDVIPERAVQIEASKQLPPSIPPIKELMADMLEMCRGVQHPTRGLFLRYFLLAVTRDYLPDGHTDSVHGNVNDSIQFILSNFVEMNKLWVRIQHQGALKDLERRESERKELRLLVGSNLVRLSQLEGLTADLFTRNVLPNIFDEVISCRDSIAQEYLMEVTIQVFPDEFHLQSLNSFLSTTLQLEKQVNIKQIVVGIVDRFSSFAIRSKEEDLTDGQGLPEDVNIFEVFWGHVLQLVEARSDVTYFDLVGLMVSLLGLALNCYPEKIEYVDQVFHFAYHKLETLENNVYVPGSYRYLINSDESIHSSLQQLLLLPIYSYKNDLIKLQNLPSSSRFSVDGPASGLLFGSFSSLLFMQPYHIRRFVSHVFMKVLIQSSLQSDYGFSTFDGINGVFGEICSCSIREQDDGGLYGNDSLKLDWDDVVAEQHLVARIIHMVKAKELDETFQLLTTLKQHLQEGGSMRVRFTIPALVHECLKLATEYGNLISSQDGESEKQLTTAKLRSLYQFISQTIQLLTKSESNATYQEDYSHNIDTDQLGKGLLNASEMALRLYVMTAQSCDRYQLEEISYENFTQAFIVYEDSISESTSQRDALNIIVSALQSCTIFSYENLETLITKCVVHASRLLKRFDQCRSLLNVSHLFWANNENRDDGTVLYRDGQRVLECLQKSLKIADSVLSGNIELFVEVLERCLWYFEKGCDAITANYISSLITLIIAQVNSSSNVEERPQVERTSSGIGRAVHYQPMNILAQNSESNVLDNSTARGTVSVTRETMQHFKNILLYIELRKKEDPIWLDIIVDL